MSIKENDAGSNESSSSSEAPNWFKKVCRRAEEKALTDSDIKTASCFIKAGIKTAVDMKIPLIKYVGEEGMDEFLDAYIEIKKVVGYLIDQALEGDYDSSLGPTEEVDEWKILENASKNISCVIKIFANNYSKQLTEKAESLVNENPEKLNRINYLIWKSEEVERIKNSCFDVKPLYVEKS